MRLSTLKIRHDEKKSKPIFSLDINQTRIVTASLHGEMKIWTRSGDLITTVTKHTGAVLCVRFSPCGDFIVSSGDDNLVIVYDKEGKQIHTLDEHTSDVVEVFFTEDYLVSVSYDGHMCYYSDFRFKKRIKVDEKPIKGATYNKKKGMIVVYVEGGVKLISVSETGGRETSGRETEGEVGQTENPSILPSVHPSVLPTAHPSVIKEVSLVGFVLESFFCRMNWSPDYKYVSVGLSFNENNSSVDIYKEDLTKEVSLLGHVAPSEVTSFYPFIMEKEGKKFYILVVASQDLSLSFWTSVSPKPFLLIKNVVELPILDIRWSKEGEEMFLCSYDGSVKKIEFSPGELGKKSKEGILEEQPGVFYSMENIEMVEKEDENKGERDKKESNKESNRDCNKESNRDCNKDCNKDKKDKDPPSKAHNEKVKDNQEPIKDSNKDKKNPPSTSTVHPPPVQSNQPPKKKKISPILLSLDESPPVITDTFSFGDYKILVFSLQSSLGHPVNQSSLGFPVNQSSLGLPKGKSSILVQRGGVDFFTIKARVAALAASPDYIGIYSPPFIKVYSLHTGGLVMPFFSATGSVSLDLYKNLLLVVESGEFRVVDLKKGKCKIRDKAAPGIIKLDKKYFLILKQDRLEYFYDRKSSLWLTKKGDFNTLETEKVDYEEEEDETLDELENTFYCLKAVEDKDGMIRMVKRMVRMFREVGKKEGRIEGRMEGRMTEILRQLVSVGEKREVIKMVEEMNEIFVLQGYVVKIYKKIREGEW